jgi:hypothetical protein
MKLGLGISGGLRFLETKVLRFLGVMVSGIRSFIMSRNQVFEAEVSGFLRFEGIKVLRFLEIKVLWF